LANQFITNGLTDFKTPELSYPVRFPALLKCSMYCCFLMGQVDHIGVMNGSINSIAGTHAGVVSVDGNTPNIKGARADGTAYFIDGVRVYHFEPLGVF
jgi:hypothetical protein